MLKIIKEYYKKNASNVLLACEFSFKDSQASLVVFWVFYYFNKTGFEFAATWIAMAYPIGTMIGSFLVNPLLKKCPTLPRATCGGWQERMVAITPQNFYVQVAFSKEDRLSIGCPVPKMLAFEERPHGRPLILRIFP